MSRPTVTFNGTTLTNSYTVSDLRRSLLPRNLGSETVPGADGALFTGATIGTRTVTMTLTVRAATAAARETAARTLASTLDVDEPKPLSISIDGGLYLMAMPESGGDADRYRHATSFQVTFTAFDPVMYGEERTYTVPSGGSVSVTVAGTYPTMPTITAASAVRNSTLGQWRITLDNGDYLAATLPTANATAVTADCAKRVLTVAGNVALMPPDGDWLVLTPGTHTLTMSGTGAATVKFRERWL